MLNLVSNIAKALGIQQAASALIAAAPKAAALPIAGLPSSVARLGQGAVVAAACTMSLSDVTIGRVASSAHSVVAKAGAFTDDMLLNNKLKQQGMGGGGGGMQAMHDGAANSASMSSALAAQRASAQAAINNS